MDTITFEEFLEQPEKLDSLLKKGSTVRVTKGGVHYFDAVPRLSSSAEFNRKIDEIWAGTDVVRTTDQIVESLRESRERPHEERWGKFEPPTD
jgi:hypothetical protein